MDAIHKRKKRQPSCKGVMVAVTPTEVMFLRIHIMLQTSSLVTINAY